MTDTIDLVSTVPVEYLSKVIDWLESQPDSPARDLAIELVRAMVALQQDTGGHGA